MQISRNWATPLVAGAFAVMAVTGALMFFHVDSGLNELAHEWLGWVTATAAAAHVTANGVGLRRYLLPGSAGRRILVASLLLLAGSFVPLPGADGDPPPLLALQAITHAPLEQVALLAGKPVDRLIGELAAAGIRIEGPRSTLAGALGGDRAREGAAMRVVFGGR